MQFFNSDGNCPQGMKIPPNIQSVYLKMSPQKFSEIDTPWCQENPTFTEQKVCETPIRGFFLEKNDHLYPGEFCMK